MLALIAGLTLGFQTINLGGFDRGDDTPLGLKLGLDLRGGSHLVYQADLTNPATGERIPPSEEQMQSLLAIIERRANGSGLGEPIVQILGDDRVLIQLPGISDPVRAKSIIGETARLEFKHRSFNVPRTLSITPQDIVTTTIGAFPSSATSTPSGIGSNETSTSETSTGATPGGASDTSTAPSLPYVIVEFTDTGAAAFGGLVDEFNNRYLSGSIVYQQNPDIINVSVQGKTFRSLSIPALFITRIPGSDTKFAIPLISTDFQPLAASVEDAQELFGAVEVTFGATMGVVDEDIGLTGDDLSRAYAGTHSTTGQPIVNIEFNGVGARKFGELTARIVNTPDRIAILLDDEELIAPAVNSVITGGLAFIQGADFTPERVRDIASLLEAGRLPIPVQLVQERQVDAILGADSLSKSVIAGLIGLAMVVAFMIVYYKVPGVVAALALIFYAALNLAIFKLIPVTLTLSGVAAAVLAIGMAVDANILVFERMKEELRAGRTLLSATNIGFNRAWTAIRDSHVATLISTAILFWFADQLGATVVKGFAATLAIGTILNLFTALTVTHVLLRAVTATRLAKNLGWFAPLGSQISTTQQQRQAPGTSGQRS